MDDLPAGVPLDGIGINISRAINRAFAGLVTADWGMLDSPIRGDVMAKNEKQGGKVRDSWRIFCA